MSLGQFLLAKLVMHLLPSGLNINRPIVERRNMPNNYENRVLSRRNARQLSAEEYNKILEQGKTQMTQLPSIPFNPDF